MLINLSIHRRRQARLVTPNTSEAGPFANLTWQEEETTSKQAGARKACDSKRVMYLGMQFVRTTMCFTRLRLNNRKRVGFDQQELPAFAFVPFHYLPHSLVQMLAAELFESRCLC